jgi:hypothetical protein
MIIIISMIMSLCIILGFASVTMAAACPAGGEHNFRLFDTYKEHIADHSDGCKEIVYYWYRCTKCSVVNMQYVIQPGVGWLHEV